MFRNGTYLETPQLPSRLGYEAAGIVDAVGKNVTDFKVGDRVSAIPAFSMGQYGVYAERAVVPINAVVKCPESFTAQQSAAIWMQYLTAYGALINIGQLKQGQRVLITAASSSAGVAAIQIAKSQGAVVIATTRGESKKQFLLEHGALDNEPTPYPLFAALAKGLIIQGYTLFEITQDKDKLEEAKAFLLPLFDAKKLMPVIDKVFTFNQIQQAHEYMESNQQMGKIVISV